MVVGAGLTPSLDASLPRRPPPGAVVSVVARRHRLSPQHLFTWLRAVRRAAASVPVAPPLAFVQALVGESGTDPVPRRSRPLASQRFPLAAEIELDMAGLTVRISESAREETIAAVIQALKATA